MLSTPKIDVSATTLNKIFKRYPEYKDFVLTGEGEMLESLAKAAKVGLWAQREPVRPWTYRKEKKHKE
jgi:endonuclease YncB( thermonuclease family)